MTPLRLSAVWHRRLYEVSFIISVSLAALYVVSAVELHVFTPSTTIPLIGGIGAGIIALASAVCWALFKRIEESHIPSIIIYALFIATLSYIIWNTGGIQSPFIALWSIFAFFAALFGAYGWVSLIVLSGVSLAVMYLGGDATDGTLARFILASLVPLAAGIFVWRENKNTIDESRKGAQKLANELSEVAAKSEIIINAIGDGVIAIDSKGTIELINPAAQEILGWGKQDAVMLHYASVLKLAGEEAQDVAPSQDPIQQVLNTNQQSREDKLFAVTKSGKRINISLVASPIGDAGSGAIAVFRDTTKERSEEREQAEFISTASHEMRTPVASIEGYLGLALNPNTAQVDEKARDFITKASDAAKHLGRLFQDLLDVSKSEDGRMTNIPKVIDVTLLASTVTQGHLHQAQEKNLSLIFTPEEYRKQKKILPVLFVNQDNDHIHEILDNLIENAIKYTPQGSVVVDVQGTDNKVIVSVKDSGLGIPAEDLPHLFQKFYRIDNTDRQEIGGTGLGLYLARRLAESMQGRLWVESEHGKGSTFFLELPRIDNSEAEQLKSQQAQEMLQRQSAPQAPVAPELPPVVAAPVQETPSQQQAPVVQPATTVPRGESLSAEQKAARVRQLQELAKQQRESQGNRE